MFARLAGFVDRRAKVIVVAWILAAGFLTLTAPSLTSLGTGDQTAFVPAGTPSRQADLLMRREFPDDLSLDPVVVVLSRPAGLTPDDHAYIAGLVGFLSSPAASAHVKSVQSASTNPELAPVLRSGDGAAELTLVGLRSSPFSEGANRGVAFLRRHMAESAPAGLEHHVTGLGALAADQTEATLDSFDRTAAATVFLVLLILVAVYRSAVAPLISLVSIGAAFLVARGLVALLAEQGLKVSSLAETFMIVIAFGAGTDYCLFVISRYRERLGQAVAGPAAAVKEATAAVGPVITASAGTVIAGFLAFLGAQLGVYVTSGHAMALSILVTLLAGLTLTPALLRLAGRHAFWPSRHPSAPSPSARWERLAGLVTRRPAAVLAAGLVLLLVPAAGLTRIRQSFDLVAELPPDTGARQGFDALGRHFPEGALSPVYVGVSSPEPLTNDAQLSALDRLTDALRDEPGVAEVRSITQPAGVPLTTATVSRLTGGNDDLRSLGLDPDTVDVTPLVNGLASPRGLRIDAGILTTYPQLRERLGFFLGPAGTTTRLVVAVDGSPFARRSLELVRGLDQRAAEILAGSALAGSRVTVAGPSAFLADIEDIAASDVKTVGALVVAATLVILALLLRSLLAPIYLMASVLLSLASALGLTAIVFQGIFRDEGLAFWLPAFLFVILVALGADYNIFIAGRIREELDAGHPIDEAVRRGLVLTGRVITSAGFILAGTFGALLLSPLSNVREIGFAVAAGVLLDTFVVRSFLVPAATVLLGRFAFWPSGTVSSHRQRRAVLGLSGAGGVAVAALLVAVAATRGTEAPAIRVAAGVAAADSIAGGPPAVPGPPSQSPEAVDPAGTVPSAPPVTTPTSVSPPSTAPRAVARAAPEPAPQPAATAATTTSPTAATTTTSAPASQAAPANRVAVPAAGGWRYRVEGTRKVGLAGSEQPFAEDVTTQVSRVGGTDDAPELRLLTESGSGTVDERRRYGAAAVELLATRVASGGLAYGGTFQPPQRLLAWPVRIGDTWRSDWKTEDTAGRTTSKITGERSVTVAGRAQRCYVVVSDTTLTGAVEGTQHQSACWVPGLGVSVDDEQSFQGTYRGVRFEGRAKTTLISPP